ncbi:MAG: ferritin [Clostridia bacterium]|nr:ferritin [Clostridia bacterium]
MISEKMQEKLNEQVQKEFYSAYLYLSIEAYFTSMNLNGFANWFRIQAQEERDHAMMFFDYINRVGGRVNLRLVDAPKNNFESIGEALKLTLEHEQFVTKSIYSIVDVALEERDHKTNAFLQWFVNEQVEEEENADNNIKKYELIKGDGRGILMMDAELAQRVYTPPTVAQA